MVTMNDTLRKIGSRLHPSRVTAHASKPAEAPAKTARAVSTGKSPSGATATSAGIG
jgi:hypothetical protein